MPEDEVRRTGAATSPGSPDVGTFGRMKRPRRLSSSRRRCSSPRSSPPPARAPRRSPSSRASNASPIATRRSRCCAKRRTRRVKPRPEQYQPTSVGTVLGNPTVALTRDAEAARWSTSRRRRASPTSRQGRRLVPQPRRPRARRHLRLRPRLRKAEQEGKAPAVTYAHIAREKGHSGFALQYWFFWYFNQFNDLHEGDWEGMQITFEANDAAGRAGRRTERNHPLPARRRRARQVDRRQGPEGRDAPDRLPGGGLARDLLRLRGVRRERPARLRPRLRQHDRTAARTEGGAGPAAAQPPSTGHSPGSPTTAAGANAKRASTTARPGRRRRRSGANRSPGWRSSGRPARGCRAARWPGRRWRRRSAAPSRRPRN